MVKCVIQKPFMKWVGGKTQIINDVMARFPSNMNNYYELFLGGGSVLLALLSMRECGKITITGDIHAYDINPIVINVYKNVQSNKDELFECITHYISEYDSISVLKGGRKPDTLEDAKQSKESYYYWIRNKFNSMDKDTVECAAVFLFLNKTCFRGVYREGPHGFNVPFGHYKTTPTIITKTELDKIHKLVQGVVFKQCSFIDSVKLPVEGDFVYMDPPYAPEVSTSFVKYTKTGFNLHKELFDAIKDLDSKKVSFAMSNSDVPMVRDALGSFKVVMIEARRAINSKKPQSKTMEVIVYN